MGSSGGIWRRVDRGTIGDTVERVNDGDGISQGAVAFEAVVHPYSQEGARLLCRIRRFAGIMDTL